MRLHLRSLIVLTVALTLLGTGSGAQENETRSSAGLVFEGRSAVPPALAPISGRRNAIVVAVERIRGAVVNIHSERTVHGPAAADFFTLAPSQNRINGMGTGILIDPRGYIVTNHHVIEDVNVIRVRLADGTQQNAAVVARSPEMDLALLKIDVNRPLPTMQLGTATDLMVGETVIAVGNAYGYEHTVSVGVVSAVKRDVSLNKDMSYKSLIQTDASINPGNSGGPLLNVHGELVGVNVAIRAGAQGIGFAIPVDTMIRVVSDMLRSRRRSSMADGFVCRDRLEQAGDRLARSVRVERVESGSAASQAGLQTGDLLVQVGDVPVLCSYDVERALLDNKAGDQVRFVVRRQNAEQRLDLRLVAAERTVSNTSDLVWHKLGLQLNPVDADLVTRVNRQLHGGMEVLAVNADSPAARAGIKKGDILLGLHQWETVTMDNVAYVLGHPDLQVFSPLNFYILRGGQVRRGSLPGMN